MAVSSHFVDISKEDRDKLLYDAIPKCTRVATAFWIRVFVSEIRERKHDVNQLLLAASQEFEDDRLLLAASQELKLEKVSAPG